jgi:hypothetical protein
VTGLRLSPDGTWLAATVQGEDSPVFLPDGSLLFISFRPDPAAGPKQDGAVDDAKSALWLHPAGGGDARRLTAPPGGVTGVATAASAPALVFTSPMLPGADGPDGDAWSTSTSLLTAT